jgi:hypothetical protein
MAKKGTKKKYEPPGPLDKVETFIQAAKNHGESDDPDHEVGDLQDMLRAAFRLLLPGQVKAFARDPKVEIVLDAGESCPECRAVEGTEDWGTVGDGYDGYCPSCADKREKAGVYGD